MITYIELWKATQAWTDLSTADRGAYMTALGPAIQGLMEKGVQVVSWGANEAGTFKKADYDFFAVWTFPDGETAKGFEQMVEGAGWYNYFEQVNLMGQAQGPEEIIGHLIGM